MTEESWSNDQLVIHIWSNCLPSNLLKLLGRTSFIAGIFSSLVWVDIYVMLRRMGGHSDAT
jgi:hypothetical protein